MSNIFAENDNIYMNIVMTNTDPYANYPIPAQYSETKAQPILKDPSKYYLSVVRFDIPLSEIPIFIFPVVANQSNPNLSPLIIGITNSNVDYPTSLIYTSNNNLPAPQQSSLVQVITPYYYVYSYNLMITIINTALSTSFIAAGSPGGGSAPFFQYNSSNQLISLIVSAAFINSGATIFFNEQLCNYLEAFQTIFLGASSIGKNHVMVLSTSGTNGYPSITFPTTPTYFQFTQEYNVIYYWNSLKKIIVSSNSLPTTKEYVPAYDLGSVTQSGVAAAFPIITDYTPPFETANSRSIAYYVPTSQYRLVDLTSSTTLYDIDLRIYWQDKYGNNYPLMITAGGSASIKLAFLNKKLYKNLLMK